MRLGKYFALWEFEASLKAREHGVRNNATPEAIEEMRRLVGSLLDPLRAAVGRPLVITSGYRSPAVNRLVGGSKTSAHVHGRAADIRPPEGWTAEQLARLAHSLPACDQAIWYDPERGGHVHLGTAAVGREPRRQLLRAVAGGGYVAG